HLHKLCSNTSISSSARKTVRQLIPRLSAAARGAITSCASAGHTVKQLQEDLLNGPSHVFGDHEKCRDTYCTRKTSDEENKKRALQDAGVYQEVMALVHPLVCKAGRLLPNDTSNAAEHFMSAVARFCGGKRVFFGRRGGFNRRCLAAGLHNLM